MSRVVEAIRRANRADRPEESVRLRVLTTIAVLVGVAAVGLTETAAANYVLAALILLPVGAVVSHRRRTEENLLLKAILAVAALAALAGFFEELRVATSIDDARLPLANLFLAVNVIHGFDLPQRRDLGFSIAASVTLLALAGVDAGGTWFVLIILGYAALVAAASVEAQRSAAQEQAESLAASEDRWLVDVSGALTPGTAVAGDLGGVARPNLRPLVSSIAVLLLIGMALFLLLPRASAARLTGLPFEGFGGSSLSSPRVSNAGLPFQGGEAAGDNGGFFNPDAFAGFAEVVDLRLRGELADTPVLEVRSDRPRLLRGVVFDEYDGITWRRTAPDPELVEGIPANVGRGGRWGSASERTVQTIELLADTPNLLFGAAEPSQVYHAAGNVWVWDDGTLTTGAEQEAGVLYSVVSTNPRVDHELLLADGARREWPEEIAERYLQLPDELPDRVRELALELTEGLDSPYAKAVAIQDWLGDNVEYAIDPTPLPRGRDTVDWFLFDHQIGWCEPIATSMVVLLRAAGVPARMATGFMPGLRNPLTGRYQVQLSDAHAWVEWYEPTFYRAWLTMDPTGAVPPAALDSGATASRFVAIDLAVWMRDRVLPVLAARRGELALAAVALALAAVAARAAITRRRERLLRARPAFEQLEHLLATAGLPRAPAQTPREYVATVSSRRPDIPDDVLDRLLEAEEARLYSGGPTLTSARPLPDDLELVRASLSPRGRDGPTRSPRRTGSRSE